MDINRLRKVFRELGVVRLYAKVLASNDNSKNQIYLAGDFAALHEIPHGKLERTQTTHGINLKASVDLSWVDGSGKVWPAPHAQLILYPQYPEVRLSGMLKGASWAPNAVIASRAAGRVLVLGITSDGKVYGAAAESGSDLQRSLAREESVGNVGALAELRFERQQTRIALLAALSRLVGLGWIEAKRLDGSGNILPCNAPNCGGLTLEAELGIRPNSISGPDLLGWEIKQHGVNDLLHPMSGILTLMTPEPDGGDYKKLGIKAFIETYGYQDRKGRLNRRNFGGIFKIGVVASLTGLRLELEGFDAVAGRVTEADGRLLLLTSKDRVAASWSFAALLNIWTRKHAQAAFIPSVSRKRECTEYQYGSLIHMGAGTDFVRFLKSMVAGCVYYDPGIKLETINGRPTTKRRSQFRIAFKNLNALYASFEQVDVTGKRILRQTS